MARGHPVAPRTHLRPRLLLALLIANAVASATHFADNMLRFDEYPEPAWITGPHVVDSLWLAMTPLLPLAWWLATRGRKWAALGTLWIYGILSLFTLGHYFYASPMTLSFRINALILLEAAAAALLLVLSPVALELRSRARA